MSSSVGFGYLQFTSILIGKAVVFGDTTTTRNRIGFDVTVFVAVVV